MAGINIQFKTNIETEIAHLNTFTKRLQTRTKQDMRNWYEKDVKPYMGRIIRGFRAKDVPAKNSEPYATYKSTGIWTDRKGRPRPYNIVRPSSHSLGEVGKQFGRHAHPPGQLYRGAMAVKPHIGISGNNIEFRAEYDKPFYLPVVHDGLYNLKKAYPFIDAAFVAKYELLLKRLEEGVSLIWES